MKNLANNNLPEDIWSSLFLHTSSCLFSSRESSPHSHTSFDSRVQRSDPEYRSIIHVVVIIEEIWDEERSMQGAVKEMDLGCTGTSEVEDSAWI
ncbi:hypothetical protein Y1Q_0018920 [Alligator mississippiensis]|uniref:Uncharacterized protein n=1 Tax=Alligator mississippiensis TaxID=8496 RepID=A0A151M3B1_ALLMI|nr:hypothetical protein Y1Q_0018920 [Alligator mississippiensis]